MAVHRPARFCLSQGREGEALRHAKDGLWLFEDDPPDERLARDRAIGALRARLAKSQPKSRWSSPADLLIRVLMAEALFAVSGGGNSNYEEACRLVARMASLREMSEQTAYVTELKVRFKPKRNFMKLPGT